MILKLLSNGLFFKQKADFHMMNVIILMKFNNIHLQRLKIVVY